MNSHRFERRPAQLRIPEMEWLENQSILLISPQPWEHLHVSKHHYALELADRGNRVFFLEPPDDKVPRGVHVRAAPEHAGVKVIRYRPAFPFVIRFHARRIFNSLMARQVRAILKAIGEPVDVAWSFEFNLFSDLRGFQPQLAIFHPVDPLSEKYQVDVARSADAVFSVSENILSNFRGMPVPAWFINHGLSRPFEEAARFPGFVDDGERPHRVGYAGNIMRKPLNREVLRVMIESCPEAEFHFWGPVDSASAETGEVSRFVKYLRERPNVRLHGAVAPRQLALALQQMDCFILTYSLHPLESDRSNSHKILEYLSTGKVVVSSRISTYVSEPDLMRMPAGNDDSELPALLADTLRNIDTFNSTVLQGRRRAFALDNTYSRQVDRIKLRLVSGGR